MKILITGGAGFIGSHLAGYFLNKEAEVTVIDDLSTGDFKNIELYRNNKKYRFVVDDILNEQILDRLIAENEVVIHLAAAVGVKMIVDEPVRVIRANVQGTEVVLKIANRYKRKILITSTSEVYGKSSALPFTEESDLVLGPTSKQRWAYACSKAIDEFSALAYYKEYNLPVIIVRLFNVIGPRQTGRYGMVVPRFIEQALASKPLTVYGTGEQSRCFMDVGDLLEALHNLIHKKEAVGQVFNLGSEREITINELARLVKHTAKSKSEIETIPYEKAYEKGFEDMLRRVPDISKSKKLIGFEPKISLEQSIQNIIQYQE
ncbi:MAG: GDP-mannose 4,6-dehydratase [bacterium]